jgi:hypothetical protein
MVRCTFDLHDNHLPATNITVRCTFDLHKEHLSTINIMVLCTFLIYLMQQSCKIFVEIYLKNITKGAEHRNI